MKKQVNGVLVEMTPEEIAEMQSAQAAYEASHEYKSLMIEELKAQLSATDYKTIKYAEGWLSEDEYAPIKAERQAIREKINAIEATL